MLAPLSTWGWSSHCRSWQILVKERLHLELEFTFGKRFNCLTNFMIYLYYTKLIVTSGNLDIRSAFFKRLVWSFYWLFIGKWPIRDHNEHPSTDPRAGQPLAEGFYAVLWCLRGDLEHMASAFNLQWSTSSQPCICCRANSSDIPWTDGRPEEALWQTTTWANQQWEDAHPNRHVIFKLPGVGITAFIPDVLHVFHIGCYQYAFARILIVLSHHVMPES